MHLKGLKAETWSLKILRRYGIQDFYIRDLVVHTSAFASYRPYTVANVDVQRLLAHIHAFGSFIQNFLSYEMHSLANSTLPFHASTMQ